MTGQPPPDPRPSRDRDLGFDELLAVFVALAAIGSILFWGLTRRDAGFDLTNLTGSPEVATVDESPLSTDPDARLTPAAVPSEPAASPEVVPDRDRSAPAIVRERPVAVASPSPQTEAVVPVPVVVAPAPTATPVEFSDVPADYWARPFITDLSQRGVVSGLEDGTFRPEQPVTRAEFASLIQGILPDDERQQPIAFGDVAADFWAAPAIDAAVRAGFLRGFPDGTFQPDQPVSHVQVLASLANGLRLPQPDSTATAALNVFSDASEIPQWAIPTVATATQEGLVVNHPNPEQLQPNQPATRAEVAASVYQALEATGQVEPIQSRYIVQP